MTVSEMQKIVETFSRLSIVSKEHTHADVASYKEWADLVKSQLSLPCVKSLVLKPKGVDSLIFVAASESSQIPINPLAKSLGFKEARMAADDVIESSLGLGKNDGTQFICILFINQLVTPFALASAKDINAFKVVVDSNLVADSSAQLAFRAYSKTFTISAGDLIKFFEKENIPHQVVDFSALAAPAPAAKPVKQEKKAEYV